VTLTFSLTANGALRGSRPKDATQDWHDSDNTVSENVAGIVFCIAVGIIFLFGLAVALVIDKESKEFHECVTAFTTESVPQLQHCARNHHSCKLNASEFARYDLALKQAQMQCKLFNQD
jgi:hypothetical protein